MLGAEHERSAQAGEGGVDLSQTFAAAEDTSAMIVHCDDSSGTCGCHQYSSVPCDVYDAYWRLGELINYHYSQAVYAASFTRAPPPPAPAAILFQSATVQTEVLGGDMEGLRNFLVLYQRRVQKLESQLSEVQGKLQSVSAELLSLREATCDMHERHSVESEKAGETLSILKSENEVLSGRVFSLEARVVELTELVQYYEGESGVRGE